MTYLLLLGAIALSGAVLAATATVWSQAQRRERETQLLWVGDQFRRALLAYVSVGDGRLPQRLEDLLEDPRSAAPRRFLRRIYEDPMTGKADWRVMHDPRGGINGIRSRSDGEPLKTGRFPLVYVEFEKAATYADWTFSVARDLRAPALPASGALPALGAPRAGSSPSGAGAVPSASSAAPGTDPARPPPAPRGASAPVPGASGGAEPAPAASAAAGDAPPAPEPAPEPEPVPTTPDEPPPSE